MAFCVALISAALLVDGAADSGAPTHARRTRLPQAVGAAGFIAPAAPPAALWAPSRRESEQRRLVGEIVAPAGGSREGGRRCAATPSSGLLWALREEHEQEHAGRRQDVARLLRLRRHDCGGTRGSLSLSSPSLLVLWAGAAGLDVNATVAAEAGSSPVAPPAAAAAAAAAAADAPVAPVAVGGGKKGQKKQASSIKESTSIEGKEATVIITEAGGRPHTVASKAKISAANKGKKPWNVGVGHSEETRRKIAEGARNAARRRKIKTAESLVRTRGRKLPPVRSLCFAHRSRTCVCWSHTCCFFDRR